MGAIWDLCTMGLLYRRAHEQEPPWTEADMARACRVTAWSVEEIGNYC